MLLKKGMKSWLFRRSSSSHGTPPSCKQIPIPEKVVKGLCGQEVNTLNSGSGGLALSLACHAISLDKQLYPTLSLTDILLGGNLAMD